MNMVNIALCKKVVLSQIDTYKNINNNATILGAFIFKSKRNVDITISLWNDNLLQAKSAFCKLSPEKQTELAKHTVIELPFVFQEKISVKEMLEVVDTSGGLSQVSGFITCISQAFPVYTNVPTHVQTVSNYFKHGHQNFLKSQFSEYVYIIDNRCFITADMLDVITNDKVTSIKYVNNTEVNALDIKAYNDTYWNVSIIDRDENNWCSFIVNCRRSVLKDFSLHTNCKYSNIHSSEDIALNKSKIDYSIPHLVTVFDIKETLASMKEKLCEIETIDILNAILV